MAISIGLDTLSAKAVATSVLGLRVDDGESMDVLIGGNAMPWPDDICGGGETRWVDV